MRRRPDPAALAEGVLAQDRVRLAQAITLVESQRADDEPRAESLLTSLLPAAGGSLRIGISGAPGVGKSTFVEAFGLHLVREQDQRVAVLAVDPSSPRTGGSILGDKSRMHELAQEERAFVRPSPSSATLGGVARRTRESMLVCEAAGFDVVLIETVGVGQSEVQVAEMVDFFLLLVQPGAGDELQGIKKGVVELADGFCVTKADGDLEQSALRARDFLRQALEVLGDDGGDPRPIWVTSALEGRGLAEVWVGVRDALTAAREDGRFDARRRKQLERWTWDRIDEELREGFRRHPGVREDLESLLERVRDGRMPPARAARELLERYRAAER